MTTRWIAPACRLIVAAVFIAAGIPKILEPHAFAIAVFRYQMLPFSLVNLMAIFLPWIELVAGIALLSPRSRGGAAAIILAMLIVFTVAIAVSQARGINIACGCFSVDPDAKHIGWWNLARNVGLIAMTVVGWRLSVIRSRITYGPSA
ncbi:MAG: hypothetical protein BWK77_04445 [Verrucomicrobia bacterium A1]|nr:MAG: hypothetical protein BWK77_04445 [Verrucomicrobia bacterium A1]